MRTVVFYIGMFWILMGTFLICGLGLEFWLRQSHKLEAWYEKREKHENPTN